MRLYLKATGSACYGDKGVTFPNPFAINLASLIKEAGGKRVAWCKQYGWSNQPKVLAFNGDENVEHAVKVALEQRNLPLVVSIHWRQRAKVKG